MCEMVNVILRNISKQYIILINISFACVTASEIVYSKLVNFGTSFIFSVGT